MPHFRPTQCSWTNAGHDTNFLQIDRSFLKEVRHDGKLLHAPLDLDAHIGAALGAASIPRRRPHGGFDMQLQPLPLIPERKDRAPKTRSSVATKLKAWLQSDEGSAWRTEREKLWREDAASSESEK